MITASIPQARIRLARLLRLAQKGETVVITAGPDKVPIARLEPIARPVGKRLGALETPGFTIPESFNDPLPEEELRRWEGSGSALISE